MLKRPRVGSVATVRSSVHGRAALLLIAVIASLYGCGDDSSTGPESTAPTVASVEVAGPGSPLNAFGATVQYAAVARDAQGGAIPGKTFVWSSSDPTVATIEANGLATAVSNGTTTIRAQTQGVSDAIELTVGQQAASVTVSPAVESLSALGDTVRFIAQITDGKGHSVEGATCSWLSTDPTIVSVSSTGLATAVSPGVAHVTASMDAMTDTAQITVGQSVETLTVSPTTDTLTAFGDTVRFAAVLRDSNGNPIADATVVWRSTQPSLVSVNADGLATAVANGDAAIVATSGTASDTALVVVGQAVESVEVSPAADTLVALGDTVRLVAEITDRSGAPVEDQSVAWTSTDPSVVTVDSYGLATAASKGTSQLVGAVGAVSDTAVVHVEQQVVSVDITPAVDTLSALGDTARLAAVPHDANGHRVPGQTITWTALDPSVASVDQAGLTAAVANGQASVAAVTAGKADTAAVWVIQAVDTVELSPTSGMLEAAGDTLRLVASVLDRNGHAIPGAPVSWASSALGVATVDGSGLVTAVAYGSTEITASSGGRQATAEVSVTVPGTIVFSMNGDLHSIRSDGTDLFNITNGVYAGSNAVVSPDGMRVAYENSEHVYVINIDGSNQEMLYVNYWRQTVKSPSWSPDGSHLVVSVRETSARWWPLIVNAQTGSVQLINHTAMNHWDFSWAGADSVIATVGSGTIRVFGINHGAEVVLAPGTGPRFSPTGDHIAFHNIPDGEQHPQLFVMDSEGQNVTQVTTSSVGAVNPTWSPDGTRLAYTSVGELWVINVDGTGARQLTSLATGSAGNPSWYN